MNQWQKPHIFKGIPVSLPPVPYFAPFLPPTSSIRSPDHILQGLYPPQFPIVLHSHQRRAQTLLREPSLCLLAVETILHCMNTSFIKDGLFQATKINLFFPSFPDPNFNTFFCYSDRKQTENRPMIQQVDTHSKIGSSTISIQNVTFQQTGTVGHPTYWSDLLAGKQWRG